MTVENGHVDVDKSAVTNGFHTNGVASAEDTPSLPSIGEVWSIADFKRACGRSGKGPAPFQMEMVEEDEDNEEVEKLTLRCAMPARPACTFHITAHCAAGSDGQKWTIDDVCEEHTHWQSVFAVPEIRQAAIEAGALERERPRTPSPPPALSIAGLPHTPDRPLMWSPSTSRSPVKRPKLQLALINRPLPALVTLEQWEQNHRPKLARPVTPDGVVEGSSRDLEKPVTQQPPSPSKLIATSFSHVLDSNIQPFTARPSSPQISDPPRYGKAPMREEEMVIRMDLDEPILSPRTELLNAVAKVEPAPVVPDTPSFVQPAFDVIVDQERGRTQRHDGPVPPVPAIGSRWSSRDAFKAACQAHAGAAHPPFGFTTPSSSTSGPVKFLLYACRHYRKGGQGCPYILRVEQVDSNRPDSEWVVTHGTYRHGNHRQASPPARSGWGTGRLSVSGGKRPSLDDIVPATANSAATLPPPAPKRIRAMSPPISRTLPLESFLAGMHPLLANPACATSLRASGVDSAETLASLTAHELAALLACQACVGLSALCRAVISNRVARHLDDAPNVGKRPGRKPRTVLGCLLAMHPSMFPREGDGALVSKLLEDAGILDADMLKTLDPEELVEVVQEIPELSDCQKMVLVNRIPLLSL